MLAPEGALSRRIQLLPFVREISWAPYGSEFEASLLLYREIAATVGTNDSATVRKRLRLRPPAYLRTAMENDFPASLLPTAMCAARRTAASAHFPRAPLLNEPAMHCLTSSSCAAAWKTCTPTLSIPPARCSG